MQEEAGGRSRENVKASTQALQGGRNWVSGKDDGPLKRQELSIIKLIKKKAETHQENGLLCCNVDASTKDAIMITESVGSRNYYTTDQRGERAQLQVIAANRFQEGVKDHQGVRITGHKEI
jgi:microcompartment protein CcmK/EutM